MKPSILKYSCVLVATLIVSFSSAQISSSSSVARGSTHKGDSVEYTEDRTKHVHEQTIVINEKEKGKPAHDNKSGNASTAAGADTTHVGNNSTNLATDTANTANTTIINQPGMGNTEVNTAMDKNLIYTAIAVFGLAALIGMYLLTLVLKDKKRPIAVALVHGGFALLGIGLLAIYCFRGPGPMAALVVFILAALGGIILFYTDVTGKEVPKWLGWVHGATAIIGYALLLVFAFSQSSL